MPKIEIFEDDLTQTSGTVDTDIPYIPGFAIATYAKTSDKKAVAGKDYYTHTAATASTPEKYEKATVAADADISTSNYYELITPYNVPTLCTSVAQFKNLFGAIPHIFSGKFELPTENADGEKILFADQDTPDKSYIMAVELLNAGMSILYEAADPADAASNFEDMLSTAFSSNEFTGTLVNKNEYSVKYITTGGYPNFWDNSTDFTTDMITLAKTRSDCVALIEAENDATRVLYSAETASDKSIHATLASISGGLTDGEFGAMFTPWANYSLTTKYEVTDSTNTSTINTCILPGCYGYLRTLASNLKTSPNWLAMAGTTRGKVPNILNLNTGNNVLTNAIANSYQEGTVAINAITDIKPYGLTIWGNRTLRLIETEGTKGTNFLNTRNMTSDIKKVAYRVAKSLLFEQNSELLWNKFKAGIQPYLEQLKTGNGIKDYKLVKGTAKYNGNPLSKEEFACAIKIVPLYAVEAFEIAVVIGDSVEVQ